MRPIDEEGSDRLWSAKTDSNQVYWVLLVNKAVLKTVLCIQYQRRLPTPPVLIRRAARSQKEASKYGHGGRILECIWPIAGSYN